MGWELLQNGVVSIIDTWLLFYFLSIFLQRRALSRLRTLLPFAFILVSHLAGSLFIPEDSPWKTVYVLILDVLFCSVLFQERFLKRTGYLGLYYIAVLIVELPFIALYNNVDLTVEGVTFEEASYSLKSAILILVMRIFLYLLIALVRRMKLKPVRRNQWQGLLFVPAISVAFMFFIFIRYWELQIPVVNTLLLIFGVFLVVQNVFVLAYMGVVQSSTERYFEMKAAFERSRQYAVGVSAIQKATRKIAHDVRHHVIYLMGALEQEDIPKAKTYLVGMDENLENLVPHNITGNYDVDALLFAKSRHAEQHGISFDIQGTLPKSLGISPIDLNMLLGNALENAIEAAAKVEGAKTITTSFIINRGHLHCVVSNPYEGRLRKKANGMVATTKRGGGLGLEIMDQVARKYDGTLITNTRGQTFTLTILLRLQDLLENCRPMALK